MRFVTVSLVLVVLATAGQAKADDRPTQRPNVLFISIDDLNDWVGVLGGHPQAKTPNIDKLAGQGLLFTKAYCAAPACNASRIALLTGMSPHVSGVYENLQRWRQIQPDAITLPQHFTANGYWSAGAGKIFHNPHPDPISWQDYFPSKTRHFPAYLSPPKQQRGKLPWWKGRYVSFDWGPLDAPLEETGDFKCVEWISQQFSQPRDEPFFLACGIYRPHVPWFVPRKYFDMFPLDEIQLPRVNENDLDDVPASGRKGKPYKYYTEIKKHAQQRYAVQAYLASIAYADELVGRLMGTLEKSQRAENTIVVLWSDHGWHLGEKLHWRKFTLWEESTRVPLIVVAPKGASSALPEGTISGSRCQRTVGLIDLYPTLIELCGLSPREGLSGRSLVALMKDPDRAWPHPVLTTSLRGNHAVRDERWRFIRYHDGGEELYDHHQDPQEWTNLAGDPQYQPVITRLAKLLPKEEAPFVPANEWFLERQAKQKK